MKNLISTKWNSNFAYGIGLLTADGCLSSDGRHIEFTSKDKEQVLNFAKCFKLKNKIGRKARANEKIKKYYRVQFGSVQFYKFLKSIGFTPKKSLVLKKIKVPKRFFPDFLRGFFDGDGTFYTFKHPESRYIQMRTKFYSASPKFLRWLRRRIKEEFKITGFITKTGSLEALEYAISESLSLLKQMYYSSDIISLSRKFDKIKLYADVAELV